ncbi:hypothetical protein C8Q80DRAFT_1113325 [Daedaleopsis nitida]|nr:hypothetical protein C8Q80DRAFT_1113325 [Daedaleopsis nitida]
MHNLFLGELRHHCMEIFLLDVIAAEKPKGRKLTPYTPEQQQAALEEVLRGVCEQTDSILEKIRVDYLLAVAQFNDIIKLGVRPTKRVIIDAFMEWVNVAATLRLPPTLSEPSSEFYVPELVEREREGNHNLFKRPILDQLRQDIASIVLPSWLEKPPSNIGDASHGKLKADQWRTLCSIHMVITLARLWGHSNATVEEQAVLQNFVHLVIATDLASRRSMSPQRAAEYDRHMLAYLQGIVELFDVSLVPNHHLALHLTICLAMFGPVHGWWSYPFERYNGMLQRLNTNHKAYEIPMTFMRYFYMGVKLRWITNTVDWPTQPVYQRWFESFRKTFNEQLRGTRVTDALSFEFLHSTTPQSAPRPYDESDASPLSSDVYDSLLAVVNSEDGTQFASAHATRITRSITTLPTHVQFIKRIVHNGVGFTAGGRNSYVTYRIHGAGHDRVGAGRIDSIFYHRRVEGRQVVVKPYVVIHEYQPLSQEHERYDPYRQFEGLNTQLYYDTFDAIPRVVALEDIVAHFAAFVYKPNEIRQRCVVVRSLDRVSGLLNESLERLTRCLTELDRIVSR